MTKLFHRFIEWVDGRAILWLWRLTLVPTALALLITTIFLVVKGITTPSFLALVIALFTLGAMSLCLLGWLDTEKLFSHHIL